jgi:putative FmdB family regulatory protein
MPLYTYECNNCGVVFERLQKFTDKPIKRCPECNKNSVKKVIQPAGIIFKGSGWYKTDSRSSSTSTPASSSKSKKSESQSETKTESKSTESTASSSTTSNSD